MRGHSRIFNGKPGEAEFPARVKGDDVVVDTGRPNQAGKII
jgi:hypothetical protein